MSKRKNRMPRIGLHLDQRRTVKKKSKAASAVIVKKVVLPPAGVVEVVVPKGVIPAVVPDPSKGTVTIVSVPVTKLADKNWFQRWFG